MSAIYRLYYPDSLVSVRYISICNMCVGDKKFLYKHLIANKIVPEQWYKMEELVMNFSTNSSSGQYGSWDIWKRTPPKKPLFFLKSLKRNDLKLSATIKRPKKYPSFRDISGGMNADDIARLADRLNEIQGEPVLGRGQTQLNIQPEGGWQEIAQNGWGEIRIAGEQQQAPMGVVIEDRQIAAPIEQRLEWAPVNHDPASLRLPAIHNEPQAYVWNDEDPF